MKNISSFDDLGVGDILRFKSMAREVYVVTNKTDRASKTQEIYERSAGLLVRPTKVDPAEILEVFQIEFSRFPEMFTLLRRAEDCPLIYALVVLALVQTYGLKDSLNELIVEIGL